MLFHCRYDSSCSVCWFKKCFCANWRELPRPFRARTGKRSHCRSRWCVVVVVVVVLLKFRDTDVSFLQAGEPAFRRRSQQSTYLVTRPWIVPASWFLHFESPTPPLQLFTPKLKAQIPPVPPPSYTPLPLQPLPLSWPTAFFPCLLYTSPSPRDRTRSRMPSSA